MITALAGGISVLSRDGASTGAISGVVTDLEGTGLARVQLSLYRLFPGEDQWKAERVMRKISDDEGNDLIEGIPLGNYMVRARLEGFVSSRAWEVPVLFGERRTVDLALPAGGLGDEKPRILSGLVHTSDG